MKKFLIVFVLIFVFTLTVPFLSLTKSSNGADKGKSDEMVTIFSDS